MLAASAFALHVWQAKAGKKGGIPSAMAARKARGGAIADDYRKFEND